MAQLSKWETFIRELHKSRTVNLVGPFAAAAVVENLQQPTVFIDRGTQFRRGNVGISVGDGDSADCPLDHRLDPDKDFSDLAYVLTALPASIEHLGLFGFLGGRRDHELLNFGEVHHFLQSRKRATEAIFDDKVVAYSKGSWEFALHGLFSLIAFAPTRVKLTGDCRFKIPELGEVGPLSSLGLSNEANGKVRLQCEGPVFIFRAEEL